MALHFEGRYAFLRPLTLDDAEITLKWRLGLRAQYLQRGAQTVEEQRDWIAQREGKGDLNFIIEHRGRPVGMIGITDINTRYKRCELGRELIGERVLVGTSPVTWETEILLCDYIFGTMGMHQIHGDVIPENKGMIKTRLYLGYRQDGILRDWYIYDGEFRDTVLLSLVDTEYWKECRPKLVQLMNFCQ